MIQNDIVLKHIKKKPITSLEAFKLYEDIEKIENNEVDNSIDVFKSLSPILKSKPLKSLLKTSSVFFKNQSACFCSRSWILLVLAEYSL